MAKNKDYGSKGQTWHPEFIKYIEFIANHPIYKGMPDAFKEDGLIQWEAPSNRTSGIFKDTHSKRLTWWREKAKEIRINISSANWISKTAKTIHPTKKKPCKRCGRIMYLRYMYPSKILEKRILKLGINYELNSLNDIISIIKDLFEKFNDSAFTIYRAIFQNKNIEFPENKDLEEWITWLDKYYIPSEPSTLSPGAMSNAPDRFDGFHSFNICCRGTADTGRNIDNLRTYSTDRRVFEYWSEGNWIAADRLMGQIRTIFRDEKCLNDHNGPCDADHIGPLSLGFCHHPHFQLLCSSCNSSKNNRMSMVDVEKLLRLEKKGEKVISWYTKDLWDLKKLDVNNEETALRLSKLLRDNQRNVLYILGKILDQGHLVFLSTLLELNYAEYDYTFKNLRIENSITVYDSIETTPRTTKYSLEQKARRIRIALSELIKYKRKENRHSFIISNQEIENKLEEVDKILKNSNEEIIKLNMLFKEVLLNEDSLDEERLRLIISKLPTTEIPNFIKAKEILKEITVIISNAINSMWNDSRYVREDFNFDN